jgi:hypothetical protein
MIRLFLPILLLFFAWFGDLAASELLRTSRVDTKNVLQIYFTFDEAPVFSGTSNKRRVDVQFEGTEASQNLQLFSPDEKIVKTLTRKNKDVLIVSFFFRYEPQQYKLTANANNSVVLEVLLGNEYSTSYKNLAEKLKGLTVVDRATPDFTNPYILSPYKSDWKSFFSNYESEIQIKIPVTFTPPPFPVIELLPPGGRDNLDLLTEEMMVMSENQNWDTLASTLLEKIQITTAPEAQKLLALTYGEALMRSGNFEGAFKQLYLLKEEYAQEHLGVYANYLLIWLRARYEDPYIAEYEYRSLAPKISQRSPIAPYFHLSQVETSLATQEYKHLNELLLLDSIALPAEIQERMKIRQADYWYATKQTVKAYAAYKLLENSPLLRSQPYSSGSYCSTLYDQRYFQDAAKEYRSLKSLVSGEQLIGLIAYRENMSKLQFTERQELIDDFSQIENAYPGTDAGLLAAIKTTDLRLLTDSQWTDKALENYQRIAQTASSRAISEEAEFKTILIHALKGENGMTVSMLHNFLREFQTGGVRISAQALLIDILPKEIKRLVDAGDYIEALVLAKQNKELFQNNWINSDFLVDIAEAYHKVGIYDESQKLYLYLIEIRSADEREKYYLPMIQATFDHGNFSLVEDYAAQYTYNYPEGKYSNEILLLRIKALVADERLTEALQALPSTLPDDRSFHPLAAALFFRTDNYDKTISTLNKLQEINDVLTQQQFFFLAESSYQTGNLNYAAEVFNKITKDNPFYHQSLYRLAEINREQGNEEIALTFLQKIVETEENSKWKQYAERDLQYAKQKDRY